MKTLLINKILSLYLELLKILIKLRCFDLSLSKMHFIQLVVTNYGKSKNRILIWINYALLKYTYVKNHEIMFQKHFFILLHFILAYKFEVFEKKDILANMIWREIWKF